MTNQRINLAAQQTVGQSAARQSTVKSKHPGMATEQALDDYGGGWLTALRFALPLFLLTGLIYPAVATFVGGLAAGDKATGSPIYRDGKAIGSALIGQRFAGMGYFHGRPSAANYDPMATAGSNLAPSNPALRERASADSAKIQEREGVAASAVPVDLISASGSGLDPHITPASALLQIPRVAGARGLAETAIKELVEQHIETPVAGIFGQPRVNVLLLNLALDDINPSKKAGE